MQAVEGDAVAFGHDALQQLRVPPGLVRQAEPGGLRSQTLAEPKRGLRANGEAVLVAERGLRVVKGRHAELVPVLPVEGEGKPRPARDGHGGPR